MKFKFLYRSIFVFLFFLVSFDLFAQRPAVRPPQGAVPNLPGVLNRGGSSGSSTDTLRRRNNAEDSVSIHFYYLDSARSYGFDSSLNDFTTKYPIPATHIYLGNTGSPTRSVLFAPQRTIGWDPGFHALDVYRWKLESVRFFNTSRPFTELGYMLGSKAEQIIEVLHTQNIKPYWNASFNYRLISSPGLFRNQKAHHNNYLLTSWYQSPAKRYNNYFVFLNNKLQGVENGGIRQDKNYLADPVYERDRFTIPTNIAGQPTFGTDFFSSALYTGHREKDLHLFMRQQLDFGRKDSLVTDSTVIPLFFPKVRMEHNIHFAKHNYLFQDYKVQDSKQNNVPDSAYYASRYNLRMPQDSLLFQDKWREISNDFSIYQFPDEKNLQQFIKVGAELQLLKGELKSDENFYNIIGHGEYRNRTKNQKWDMLAFGKLFFAGENAGDYHAFVSLQRSLGERLGSLKVGFENINRSPSFIYRQSSNFYFDAPRDFSKENNIHFFASVFEPRLKMQLSGDYYLVSNYLYLSHFSRLKQESSVFNVLKLGASKTFGISKFWNWYSDVFIQQKAGAVELNLPFLFTRNRLAFEGNFFRNLFVSAGTEIRYYTPHKADDYSPVLGKFFYQDSITINNRPDISAFVHLRIRSFRAYVRAENLNTASTDGGFHFNHNNMAAPAYPTPGLVMRLGIYWSFVN